MGVSYTPISVMHAILVCYLCMQYLCVGTGVLSMCTGIIQVHCVLVSMKLG